VLDYANAMVPNKQPRTSAAESNWQEHISGYPRITPPVPPLAPAKVTGSISLVTWKNPARMHDVQHFLGGFGWHVYANRRSGRSGHD
jgi:hypothetical protein